MMRSRRIAATVISVQLLLAEACARGVAFRAEPVATLARVGAEGRVDSTRSFFDSLASARAAERSGATAPAVVVRSAALADLEWSDIVSDSVLTAMVGIAIAQNRGIVAARARVDELRAMRGVARSPLLPNVTVNVGVGANQGALGTSPSIRYDAWRGTGDIAWQLDVWGHARHGVAAADADLAAHEAEQRATVLSVVSEVALGYFQLLELDEEHDIVLRTLASRRATLALARERFARGVVSELDVRQFEAQLAVPSVRLAQVRRQRAEQEHALNVLLGEPPTPVRRGGPLVAAARAVLVPDSLPATLLDRRPDVAQSERSYAAAAARVGVAGAARMPPIALTGFYGAQSAAVGTLAGSRTNVYQVQAGLSIPLYTGGRQREQLVAARARAEQAKAGYERTALQALREASDALTAVRTAHDEVTANETLEAALRRSLELSNLRYQSGVASLLEVLDAQRGSFDAELTLAQSRFRELAAVVQLYRALGANWVQK
jgi:multidrug efflux system outer membrane protein